MSLLILNFGSQESVSDAQLYFLLMANFLDYYYNLRFINEFKGKFVNITCSLSTAVVAFELTTKKKQTFKKNMF